MPRGKPSPKLAITVDPDVHGQVLIAAAAHGVSVSAWMTDAARRALRQQDGLAAVAEWEAEFGALTSEEMEAARRRLRAVPTKAAESGSPARLRRRSPEDIAEILDSVVGLVRKHPQGLRVEQIRAELPHVLEKAAARTLPPKTGTAKKSKAPRPEPKRAS
jgi:hypothetical protein